MSGISSEHPKVALSIAGFDPCSGAGVTADVRTFGSLGVYGTAVVTAVTYQSTLGVSGRHDLPAVVVMEQLEALMRDRRPDAVKTGMLGSAETVSWVARAVKGHELHPLVVDPVIMSSDGAPLLSEGGVEVLTEDLIPLAALVTPNTIELEALCGFGFTDLSDVKAGALLLSRRGAGAVLVTGVRLEDDEGIWAVDLLLKDREFDVFKKPWRDGLAVHGTGCVMSAAVTAALARGDELREAVAQGRLFVEAATECALSPGSGLPCANPAVGFEEV